MHQSAAAWHHTEADAGVPAGVILGINATASPGSDFALYNGINGRFAYGHASAWGSSGGSYSFSRGSNSAGNHSGNKEHKGFLRTEPGAGIDLCVPGSGGGHSHTLYGTYVPTKGELRLIKANKDGAKIPVGAISFGHQANLAGGMDYDRDYTALNDSYLYPSTRTTRVNASASGSSSSSSDSHRHHATNCGAKAYQNCCTNITAESNPSAGGSHGHSVTCSVSSLSLQYRALKAFERFVADAPSVNGMIGMWDGGVANIPDGWKLCDGANGTTDLRSRFVYISNSPGGAAGNNTITASLSTNSKSHSHGWTFVEHGWYWEYAHTNSVSHHHSATYSGGYTPEYYTAVFNQKLN